MFASAAASSAGLVLTRPRQRPGESRPLGEAKHGCQLVSPLTQQIICRKDKFNAGNVVGHRLLATAHQAPVSDGGKTLH